jgi:hypothetical protein
MIKVPFIWTFDHLIHPIYAFFGIIYTFLAWFLRGGGDPGELGDSIRNRFDTEIFHSKEDINLNDNEINKPIIQEPTSILNKGKEVETNNWSEKSFKGNTLNISDEVETRTFNKNDPSNTLSVPSTSKIQKSSPILRDIDLSIFDEDQKTSIPPAPPAPPIENENLSSNNKNPFLDSISNFSKSRLKNTNTVEKIGNTLGKVLSDDELLKLKELKEFREVAETKIEFKNEWSDENDSDPDLLKKSIKSSIRKTFNKIKTKFRFLKKKKD